MVGARTDGFADIGEARRVRRVAPPDDHEGVDGPGKARGRLLALPRSEANRVLHLGFRTVKHSTFEGLAERAGLA